MITPWLSTASAIRIAVVLAVVALAGAYALWRRERPTDWDAPAGDLNEVDEAFVEARVMETRRGGAA